MKVLSLFDGISCGRLALESAGVDVTRYYASEIDKYCIKVTQENFPDTIQLGEVESWLDWKINFSEIDLLIGGSPCQGFSSVGKGNNFNDPRSRLFFYFVDVLSYINTERSRFGKPPVKFLLENVRMKKEHLDRISSLLNVEPVMIDSSLVSAQSRKRYYWFNWNAPYIADAGIELHSILGGEVDASYKVSHDYSHIITSGSGLIDDYNQTFVSDAKKSRTLTCNSGAKAFRNGQKIVINGLVRRFTPTECERLQTIPDNYTQGISDPQRYKAIGNAWTVNVVKSIFAELIKTHSQKEELK